MTACFDALDRAGFWVDVVMVVVLVGIGLADRVLARRWAR